MRNNRLLLIASVAFATTGPVRAEVVVPGLFSDHMVLQREMALPVWGIAQSGEEVTVTLGDQKTSAKADEKGRWQV